MADALIFGEGAGACTGLDREDQTCSTRKRIANLRSLIWFYALVRMVIDWIEFIIPRPSSDQHYTAVQSDRSFFGFFCLQVYHICFDGILGTVAPFSFGLPLIKRDRRGLSDDI